jgi:hypothetical protein
MTPQLPVASHVDVTDPGPRRSDWRRLPLALSNSQLILLVNKHKDFTSAFCAIGPLRSVLSLYDRAVTAIVPFLAAALLLHILLSLSKNSASSFSSLSPLKPRIPTPTPTVAMSMRVTRSKAGKTPQ